MAFQPSPYQQAIFDFVTGGSGDGVVRATAGSGKTTTLVEIARRLPDDLNAVFLAYNKHTADELRERLPSHVRACTVHALGLRSLKDGFPHLRASRAPTSGKSRTVVRERVRQLQEEFALDEAQWRVAVRYLQDLLRFAMVNVTDTRQEEAVAALAVQYNLHPPPDAGLERQCHREVAGLLRQRLELLKTQGLYDYEDMLYLPAVYGERLPVPQHDFVFVDEAQDLSAVQLRLVLRAVHPAGRRLFVGDERQALYGFVGADPDALQRIVQATGATTLPLSVTYRCPRSHVALARQLAPEIEAAPGAMEGEVHVIREAWLHQWVRPGDLVICRYTAPLVQQCLRLMRRGVPAVVRGMDLAESLQTLAGEVYGQHLTHWAVQLPAYRQAERERIAQRAADDQDEERQLTLRMDLLDALEALTRDAVERGLTEVQALVHSLGTLFARDPRGQVVFSTVHKAKGKEADRVFILYPETMPAVYARTAVAAQGEACVQFVALTRARRSLIFVEQEQREAPDDPARHLLGPE